MSKIRRSRDINTGISYFIDIDTFERIPDNKHGSGLINTLVSDSKEALTDNKTKDPVSTSTKQKSIKNEKVKPMINTENKAK